MRVVAAPRMARSLFSFCSSCFFVSFCVAFAVVPTSRRSEDHDGGVRTGHVRVLRLRERLVSENQSRFHVRVPAPRGRTGRAARGHALSRAQPASTHPTPTIPRRRARTCNPSLARGAACRRARRSNVFDIIVHTLAIGDCSRLSRPRVWSLLLFLHGFLSNTPHLAKCGLYSNLNNIVLICSRSATVCNRHRCTLAGNKLEQRLKMS